MPKPSPVERFKVTTFATKEGLGDTIAALTKLGHSEISFDLVTDVAAFKQRIAHDTKSKEFLAAWTTDHPTFRAYDAIKHFSANGRTDGAGYSSLRELVNDGTLRKLGKGMYARADVKSLAAPKAKAKVKAKVKKLAARNKFTSNKYSIRNPEFVLRAARRNHGRFNSLSMKKLFEADGRPGSAVGPTIARLLKIKQIKRVGDGEYLLLAKGHVSPKATPKKQEPPVKANGHAPAPAPAEEVVANG